MQSQDALGNRRLNSVLSQTIGESGTFSNPSPSYDTLQYQPNTGRLLREHHAADPALWYYAPRVYSYDQAGNIEFEQAVDSGVNTPAAERAAFFAADGKLRMVDSRWAVNDGALEGERQQYAAEEYRYDALGRRVWVRARKWCDDTFLTYRPATECRVGLVRRTIWNGDQELAEIQSPWNIQGYDDFSPWDTTQGRALADSDVTPSNIGHLIKLANATYNGDANKFFGHVVYAGFRGIDQPIAITRVNYAWIQDWNHPTNVQSQVQHPVAFTIIPFWDMKGDAPQGMFADGTLAKCNPSTSDNACIAMQWPWDISSTDRQRNLTRAFWHGSLLESKRDGSGLGYSRNRYYDPATGRFTQEDPIGLAGGLNVYGFGAGDPINFADPFGLDTVQVGCRPVEKTNSFTHCAVRITDDSAGTATVYELLAKNGIGGPQFAGIEKDPKQIAKFGKWIAVPVPSGQTEDGFAANVRGSADRLSASENGKRYSPFGGSNSNAFVFSIITRAGGQIPSSVLIPGRTAPGLCGGRGIFQGFDCNYR